MCDPCCGASRDEVNARSGCAALWVFVCRDVLVSRVWSSARDSDRWACTVMGMLVVVGSRGRVVVALGLESRKARMSLQGGGLELGRALVNRLLWVLAKVSWSRDDDGMVCGDACTRGWMLWQGPWWGQDERHDGAQGTAVVVVVRARIA